MDEKYFNDQYRPVTLNSHALIKKDGRNIVNVIIVIMAFIRYKFIIKDRYKNNMR
jgi:hypothetical protein